MYSHWDPHLWKWGIPWNSPPPKWYLMHYPHNALYGFPMILPWHPYLSEQNPPGFSYPLTNAQAFVQRLDNDMMNIQRQLKSNDQKQWAESRLRWVFHGYDWNVMGIQIMKSNSTYAIYIYISYTHSIDSIVKRLMMLVMRYLVLLFYFLQKNHEATQGCFNKLVGIEVPTFIKLALRHACSPCSAKEVE